MEKSSKIPSSDKSSLSDSILNFFNIFKSDNKNKSKRLSNVSTDTSETEQRCHCKRLTETDDYCANVKQMLDLTKINSNFNSETSKKIYKDLLKVHEKVLDKNGENIKQIKKDLGRTYPTFSMFKNRDTQQKLKNVLRAFSNYEPTIKYFQGMNFIVGFFLYHCNEHVAFWLFVSLFEEYGLRDLFMEGFPGLNKHVVKLEGIIKKHFKNIYEVFAKLDVKLNIFMVEWLYSLFSSIIPLQQQLSFYQGFFSQGWDFFYKVCISVLQNLSGTFNDAEDVYIALKDAKTEENDEALNEKWKNILNKAYQIEFEDK